MVAGAGQHGRLRLTGATAWKTYGFAMGRVEPLLATPLQRRVRGDQHAVLEDADLVGEDMDVEDAPTRRVGHAVEIAANAHHAFVRGALFQPQDRSGRRGFRQSLQ